MTIWILALVLLAASIALGHKLGAINATFTFFGIVLAGLLAAPLGGVFKHLLPHFGISNPTAVWAVAPIVAFAVVLVLIRIPGHFVQRKVEVYYKYKAGDLRLALWERLNARLGACIGTLNGTAYLVLISFLAFNFSYWTAQVAPAADESRSTRLVNRLGADLQSTGMNKPARALVTMPGDFYRMADLAGLICQNRRTPGFSERLADYPAFISLAERPDLQQFTQNSEFTKSWDSSTPMGELMNMAAFKDILKNTSLADTVWTTAGANLDDLMTYLKTGKSPKYDSEKILGRWVFNLSTTMAMVRQAQPNIPASEMRMVRALWIQGYADTTFTAGADGQAFLKSLPNFKNQPPTPETWTGSWTAHGTNYDLSLANNGESKSMTAQIGGGRLTLKDDKNTLIFDRDY